MNEKMADRLRCGIIGYGYMGEIRRRVVENHPRLELAGIVEPSDRARAAALLVGRVYDSLDEMIEHSDVIFVCTPNGMTPEVCVEALSRGRHVFCEKPPGRNLTDTRAIVRAVDANQKLMFGFNHRFHPGVLKAKAIVDAGRLGKIIGARGTYGKSGGVAFPQSWRNDRRVSGGGILLDQGIHMLDLFCFFCGDFEEVKCLVSNSFWNMDVEDNAYVVLGSPGGPHATLHSSATQWKHMFRLEITMEHGYLIIEGLLSKSGSYGQERLIVGRRQFEDEASAVGNPAEEVTYFDRDRSWDLEVDEFVRCIEQNAPVTQCSAADAIRVMEIIGKAYFDAGVLPEGWRP